MNDTFYRIQPGLPNPPGLVNSYFDRYGDGMLENYSKEFNYMCYVAGFGHSGIIASLADYARFIEALCNGELISQSTFAEMTEWVFPDVSYGLGLEITESSFELGYGYSYGHQGRTFAAMIDMFYFPDSQVTIVFCTNIGNYNETPHAMVYTLIWQDILKKIFEERYNTANRTNKKKLASPKGSAYGKNRIPAGLHKK